MTMRSRPLRAAGFTLVELMVTIVVASILASIAVPSYMSQIRKSRRTEARTAVLDLATREERYFSVNNGYTANDVNLGYGATNKAITNLKVASGYYTVTVTTPASATGQPGFLIKATAAGTQAKDTPCQTFTVDQTGAQTSTPSTTGCWN
ncbi:MAG: type IV pilin protein [Steroidobacteraceae bacterium]